MVKSLFWRVAQAAAIALILFFWGRGVWLNRDALLATPWRVSWFALSLAFVVLWGQALLLAELWRRLLALTGGHLPWRTGAGLWLQAQLARYVPGGVWEVAARVALGRQVGVTGAAMSAVYGLELGLQMLSAGLFGVVALLLRGAATTFRDLTLTLALLAAAGTLLLPPIFNRLVGWGLRLLRRPAVTITISYGMLLRLFGGYLLAHGLSGLGFVLFVAGVARLEWADAPLLGVGYVASWLAGQVAIFVPTGIGVREGALGLLLAGRMSFAAVSALALGYRLWIALRDLLTALYGRWLVRKPDAAERGWTEMSE